MANQDLPRYPRGQLAVGAGDWIQCTDVEFDYSNNAKVEATLRRNPSGVVTGKKTVTVNGNSAIDEDGPEFDFWEAVSKGSVNQCRFKFPGNVTKTVNGVFSSAKSSFKIEDMITVSWTLVGALVE